MGVSASAFVDKNRMWRSDVLSTKHVESRKEISRGKRDNICVSLKAYLDNRSNRSFVHWKHSGILVSLHSPPSISLTSPGAQSKILAIPARRTEVRHGVRIMAEHIGDKGRLTMTVKPSDHELTMEGGNGTYKRHEVWSLQ